MDIDERLSEREDSIMSMRRALCQRMWLATSFSSAADGFEYLKSLS